VGRRLGNDPPEGEGMSGFDQIRDESDVRKKLGLDPVPFTIILDGSTFETPRYYELLMIRCASGSCGKPLNGNVARVAGKTYHDRCAVKESLVE
jgi:hypothetical protein